MESSAYGSSLSGGSFDFGSFIRKPHTIVRLLSWLFSIVVFATITAEGYVNQHEEKDTKCIFNQNDNACNFGNAVGILAFLACVAFIVLDAYFPQISNANQRKHIVISDLVFSGAWTFLWFVCFCFLANQWSQTIEIEDIPQDAARAVIAFSFFSVISWAFLILFAFRRYHQGVDDVGYSDPSRDQTTPYPPYPNAPDNYQQSPFTHSSAGEGTYQPPAY